MKHIILSFTFLAACLIGGACTSERDVTCDVIWSDGNDTELGRATIVYEGLDDVDMGLDMCLEEQADHPDRPTDATAHNCDCST